MASGGNPALLSLGAGTLRVAPLGSTEPTDVTTPWPVAWSYMGYTEDGSEIGYELKTEPVEVAEELDPVLITSVSRAISISMELAQITATNLKRAMNGGTIVTAAGVSTFTPPIIGAETRTMVGWESLDATERWVFRKCIQSGAIKIGRQKQPKKATISGVNFASEVVAGVAPFVVIFDDDRA